MHCYCKHDQPPLIQIYAPHALGIAVPSMHNPVMNRIKKLRKAAGLTQAQVAEQSGLHQSFISRLERNLTDVRAENLAAIAAVLKQPLSNLMPPDSDLGRLYQVAGRIPANHAARAAELLETFLAAVSPPSPKDE